MSRKSAKTKTTGVIVQKPRSNVYTMMLILSLIAIIVGIVMLNLALSQYGAWPQWETSSISVPGISSTVVSVWT